MYKAGLALALAVALLALSPLAPPRRGGPTGDLAAQQAPQHLMRTSVMGGAGAPASGSSFRANATLGQPTPIGVLTGAGEILYAGFWGRSWALTPVDDLEAPRANGLFQNYPNPFNPATAIDYSVAAACHVEIAVYDVSGTRVRTLVDEARAAGLYKAFWDGRNDRGSPVATGLYFYRARIGSYSSVKKMVLLR